MRRLKVYQRDVLKGTLPAPDSFRPPITQAELDRIPARLIARSKSWLFDVRPTDFRLELRGEGAAQEVVAVAHPSVCPGDFGCLIGFEPATGQEHLAEDKEMTALADEILAQHQQEKRP